MLFGKMNKHFQRKVVVAGYWAFIYRYNTGVRFVALRVLLYQEVYKVL